VCGSARESQRVTGQLKMIPRKSSVDQFLTTLRISKMCELKIRKRVRGTPRRLKPIDNLVVELNKNQGDFQIENEFKVLQSIIPCVAQQQNASEVNQKKTFFFI
jgi:hypothetical protein